MLEDILAWIAGLLVFYLMVIICVDVIGRYLFRSPIGWVIETVSYGLMAIPFLTMAWLVRTNDHVRVDVVLRALGPRLQVIVNFLTNLVAAAVCGTASWFAFRTAMRQFERNVQTVAIYPIPQYLLTLIIAFGLAFAAIELLRATRRAWQQEDPVP